MLCRFLVTILSCLTGLAALYAQKPFYKNYSSGNGLPTSNVYYITQDRNGYIWLATNSGVSKYDGTNFITYTNEDGLADNEVLQIHEDSKGRLWFLTMNGQPCYYINNTFYTEKNDSHLRGAAMRSFYYSFTESDDGIIYLGSVRDRLAAINKTKQPYKLPGEVGRIYFTWFEKKQLYLLASEGIYTISNDLRSYRLRCAISIPQRYICRTAKTREGIIFSVDRDLYEYKTETNKVERLARIDEQFFMITSVDTANGEKICIGTQNGVLIYEHIEDIRKHNYTPYLRGLTVTSSFNDREGSMWFATLEGGVYFTPSQDIVSYSDKLSATKVICIEKDANGKIWAGGKRNHYIILDGNNVTINKLAPDDRLGDVMAIHHNKDGTTYIAGKSCLLKLKGNSKQYIPYWGNDIARDVHGNYWIGLSVCWRVRETGINNMLSPHYYSGSLNYNKYAEVMIRAATNIIFPIGDSILIGTVNGLYIATDTGVQYLGERYTQLKDNITAINSIGNTLLIGTKYNGIIFLDKNLSATIFNKGALSALHVTSIHPENDTVIWVGTLAGLDRLKKIDGRWQAERYQLLSGLGNIAVNGIETLGKYVFLATDAGLIRFRKDTDQQGIPKPLISITGFDIDGEDLTATGKVTVPYSKNNVAIRFKSVSFKDPNAIKYLYKMEGIDDYWQTTTTTEVHYLSLPPGNYRFSVKAVTSSGVESDETKHVQFKVGAPFWETRIFYLLVIFIAIGIISIVWIVRVRFLHRHFELEKQRITVEKEKAEMERDLKELEQKAMRLQMNPHFVFNALNTIKGYYIENKAAEGNVYISKFSKLLRFILENEESLINIDTEVQMLRLYLELTQIRFQDRFTFDIEIDKQILITEALIPSMLLQPFVENAIIHGIAPRQGKGHVSISFRKEDNMLHCTVTDNGIGRRAAEINNRNREHNSMATILVQNRLEILSKNTETNCTLEIVDLYDKSGDTKGTKVIIVIPYQTA
ncbi:MAG: histidine kinase [Chitinophagales bacterium]|nr:histidine kinase [Chitinophagales bacterium]